MITEVEQEVKFCNTGTTNRPTTDPDERAVLVAVERKLKQGCTKEQVARWLQELANYLLMESEQEVKPFNTGTILAAIEAGQQPTAQDWAAFSALPEDEQDRLLDKMEADYHLLSKSEKVTYWEWKPTLTGLFLDAMRANALLAKRWF